MRKRISNSGSKRLFTATAAKVHKKNIQAPMRGGIRLLAAFAQFGPSSTRGKPLVGFCSAHGQSGLSSGLRTFALFSSRAANATHA